MTERSAESNEYVTEAVQHADSRSTAWQWTLDDMNALAEELEEEGWTTIRIQAGQTAPVAPDDGDDRLGFVFVVPGNKARAFQDTLERGNFSKYDVYRQSTAGRVFLTVNYYDPSTRQAILIAGNYDVSVAQSIYAAANREEMLRTYVQKLDGTLLGTFEHRNYEKFIPDTTAET